ncbi:MAG TPA: hypothetical protein VFJ29_03840 [Candidatus Kapabacteria bacterium]|nr:hypothetical protein [Candidatus Kapabacteria bacterium]
MKRFLLLSFILLPALLRASESDTTLSKEDQTTPWRSSFYIAMGYGYPQGFRLDMGGHFKQNASIGLSFSSGNYLPYFPYDKELGAYLEVSIPLYSVITPYLRGRIGFGGSPYSDLVNTSYSLTGGALISLTPVFQWRIECGAVSNNTHVPFGVSYSPPPATDTSIAVPGPPEFGPNEQDTHQILFCIHTGIEINLSNIPYEKGK